MTEYLFYVLILFTFFRLVKGLGFISVDEHVGKWHHFYTGALFLLYGNYLLTKDNWIGLVFVLIGLWLIWDDLYQHWKQAHGYPFYLSPVHRLGIPLYKLRAELIKKHPWFKWLDKI